MLRMAIFDELAAHEADEMDLITDVRNRQRHRRLLRAELLTIEGDRVGVRVRIHLLAADVESPLRQRLRELEDELALLRHAQHDVPNIEVELTRATEQRTTLAAFLDEHTPVVSAMVGRAPAGGDDWSLTDVPLSTLDDADRNYTALRRALVEAVDNMVDSELLTTTGRARVFEQAQPALAVLELAEHDVDAVAEVRAFVTDVRMIATAADLLRDRLRLAAMRRSVEHPRDWLLGTRLRRRDARHALERSRAVHAALTELAAIERLNGLDAPDRMGEITE